MNGMRILLVEDEREAAHMLAKGLREKSYAVDVAEDGPAALEKAEISPYDLVILDIMLPGMDGLEVCRRLRSNGTRIPILLLTARVNVDDRITGLDSGADDYLTKPFDFGELLARIRALLRRGPELQTTTLTIADPFPGPDHQEEVLMIPTRVLSHRAFRDLWIGQAVSIFGDSCYYIVNAFMIQKLTGSAALVGVAGALETLPYLFIGPYAGVVVDRVDRKRIMLLSDLTSFLTLALLGATVAGFAGKPPVEAVDRKSTRLNSSH